MPLKLYNPLRVMFEGINSCEMDQSRVRNYSAKFIFMSSTKRPWNWSWSHFNVKRERRRLLRCFTPVALHPGVVGTMAIIKINLLETPEWECCADDVPRRRSTTPARKNASACSRATEPSIRLHLNCTEMQEVAIKRCKSINCIQINASWPELPIARSVGNE